MGAEPQCGASQVVYGLSPQPSSLKALRFPLPKCFLQFVKMVRLYFILIFFFAFFFKRKINLYSVLYLKL